MGLLIEATPSENQVISGIPEYVDFSSNHPAIYFYTLDGSEPNDESLMSIDRIYLPTMGRAVTLKVVAFYQETTHSHYSEVITLSYKTTLNIKESRTLIGEGIDVYKYGSDPITSLALDSDGNPAKQSSLSTTDMDIVTSEYDNQGIPNPDRSSYDFIRFPVSMSISRPPESTSLDNIYFNPTAKVIRIDGSTTEAYESQVVRFVNRCYNSIDPNTKSSYYNPTKNSNLITGNLVRYAYNPATGIVVFYYFDSKESRWVISKQKTDKKIVDLATTTNSRRLGRYVFRWNNDPVLSRIK